MEYISKSFDIAKEFLGKKVEVVIDRPLGSKHPQFNFIYEVNYGYVSGVKMPDGEDIDAYCLGWDMPLQKARGRVVAVIHRLDDDDDKLVVIPPSIEIDAEKISRSVNFQEKRFKKVVMMSRP